MGAFYTIHARISPLQRKNLARGGLKDHGAVVILGGEFDDHRNVVTGTLAPPGVAQNFCPREKLYQLGGAKDEVDPQPMVLRKLAPGVIPEREPLRDTWPDEIREHSCC